MIGERRRDPSIRVNQGVPGRGGHGTLGRGRGAAGGDHGTPARRGRLPLGPRAGPPHPAPLPRRGGLRGPGRDGPGRRRRPVARPLRGAGRPALPDCLPRPAGAASWASSTSPTWRGDLRQDRQPPPPRLRRDARSTAPTQVLAELGEAEGRGAARRRHGREGSVLDGVPTAAPALLRAERLTEKASRIGFDWPDLAGRPRPSSTRSWASSTRRSPAATATRIEHELGDVLFSPREPGALHQDARRGRAPAGEPPLHPPLPRGGGGAAHPRGSLRDGDARRRWRRCGRRRRRPRLRFHRRHRRRRAVIAPARAARAGPRARRDAFWTAVAPVLGWTRGGRRRRAGTVEHRGCAVSFAPGTASPITLEPRCPGRRRRRARAGCAKPGRHRALARAPRSFATRWARVSARGERRRRAPEFPQELCAIWGERCGP